MDNTYDQLIKVGVALRNAEEAGDTDAVADLSGWYDELSSQHQAEERERLDPAKDMNAFSAGLVGVGETFDKMLKGVQQWGHRLTGNDEAAEALRAEVESNDAATASLKEKFPVATTVGNITPYLATAPLSGVSGALLSAAPSAIEYGTAGEQATNTAVDAAIGTLPFGIGKAARALSGADGRLADRAVELGYQLTPGEALDSNTLKKVEASMESSPFFGRGLAKTKANRQDIANKVALDAIGDNTGAKNFAGGELDGAMATQGGAAREVIESRSYPVDDLFLDGLIDAESKAKGGFFKDSGETGELVEKILGEGDEISGERMMELRSALGTEVARTSRNPDAPAEYVKSLTRISRAVDDLIGRNLSEAEKVEWQKSRAHYSAAKKLEKAKAIDAEGNVSAAKLYNSLRAQDPKGMGRNRNTSDLYDVARASQMYRQLPDSGTATRSALPYFAMSLATNPAAAVGSLAGGGLLGSVYANPTGGITRAGQGVLRGLMDYEEDRD
jgi:hypothetical protein